MEEENLKLLPAEIRAAPERRFITLCLRLGARSWYDYRFDAAPLWQDVQVNMPIIDHLWGNVFRDINISTGLKFFNKPVFLALGYFDFLVAPFYMWHTIRHKFNDFTVRLFAKSGHTPQLEEAQAFDKALTECSWGNPPLKWGGYLTSQAKMRNDEMKLTIVYHSIDR